MLSLYAVVEYPQEYRENSTAVQHSARHKAANQVRADQSTDKKKYLRTCTRRPGCFPGARSSWHLQIACLYIIRVRVPKMLRPSRAKSVIPFHSCERALRACALYILHTPNLYPDRTKTTSNNERQRGRDPVTAAVLQACCLQSSPAPQARGLQGN